jgi:outer membrane protein OmpA-like peptidoglycan-associated protein
LGKDSPLGGKDYKGKKGQIIHFPLGDVSFADEVVSFQMGSPGPVDEARDGHAALGPPDRHRTGDRNEVTLGCGGILTLRFVDNALVDVKGPDLYVFELGDDTEPTDVSISVDGKQWIRIGNIAGGTGEMDIAGKANAGEVYHFVKLTDLKSACHGNYPGADIDAVGALGAGLQISLNSAVLFDTGKYELKPEAKAELDRAADVIRAHPGAAVMIEGHTDNVGAAASNLKLSSDRAMSVRSYLAAELPKFEFRTAGYGETRPIASNEDDSGRQKNRRVDIVIVPGQ